MTTTAFGGLMDCVHRPRYNFKPLPGVAEEVFVLVDDPVEAKVIDKVNTQEAMRTKRARLKAILDRGVVDECHMPDVVEAFMARVWRDSFGKVEVKTSFTTDELIAKLRQRLIEESREDE